MNPLDIEFPDDSISFFAGFEMGVLYMRLRSEGSPILATIHTVNREACDAMALATGYHPVWGMERPAPHGLGLVDVELERTH